MSDEAPKVRLRSTGRRAKLSVKPSLATPQTVTAESVALASWYDSKPAVRRLWGVKDAQTLRVIIAVEPTLDNDDIYPAWFANAKEWTSQLHAYTKRHVQLELIQGPPYGLEIDPGSVVIAELFWRDATVDQAQEE
jgi:hypothetical protein